MLDTVHRVATPEGVELSLHPAGPVPRATAWLIDVLLKMIVFAILSFALLTGGRFGAGLLLIAGFLINWLVPAWFEASSGATPGKRVVGLRVLHDDGTPVGWPAALTRNLLIIVDFLPFGYGFGLSSMLLTRDFKRLGDLAAGTIVVHAARKTDARQIPIFAPLTPTVALSRSEQRTVLDFAERVPALTTARAEELAAIPQRLTGAHDGASALQRMLGFANHLVGR